MRRRAAVFCFALAVLARPVSGLECSDIDIHPGEHSAPGITLRTTSTQVVEFPLPGGTWHLRSCHAIVRPSGQPLTRTFDISWSGSPTISSAQQGLGSGPAPSPCDVAAGVGRIGTSNLDGGQMTAECCFLAEVSSGGCSAGDPGCTCDDPGDLEVDGAPVVALDFDANITKTSNDKCGLLGVEVLPVLGYAGWRRRRRAVS